MEETLIQKILSESYNVCNLQVAKLLIKQRNWFNEQNKNRRKELHESYTLLFRACSPLSIRLCKSATIEWE